jgi:hypothetical protein
MHFTTISRRINILNIKAEDANTENSKYNYVMIAIDNTDIKITDRGQGLRDKWNKKRLFENSYCSKHQE